MAMSMHVYRVFIPLLLVLIHCKVTVEQATQGRLGKICSDTSNFNKGLPMPPLAKEDADVISDLLGCSSGLLSESCFVGEGEVICDCSLEDFCRVERIDFSNRRLEGKITQKIGDLKYLKSLDLNGNKLSGSIPESFQNLQHLWFLSLCDNSLEGSIPSFFGEMKSLKRIYLCKNFFNQAIPPELGSLPSLEYLDLGNNNLSGKIPDELGNIKSLIGLYLSDNQLSGVLPVQLGNLENLQRLCLQTNEFIGALPLSFKSLKKLTCFNVQGNNLSETIPDIFEQWQDLGIMNLMGNNFSGPLPGQISKLKNLTELYISDLVGESSPFPNVLGMKSLRVLTLRKCLIADRIPVEIWSLSDLKYLDLSFNNLFGAIPEAVNNSLNYTYLRSNKLNETIPSWMNATSYVDVSENAFRKVSISSGESLNPNLNLFACCSNETDEIAKWNQVDQTCKNETQFSDHLLINCGGESVPVRGSDYEADVHPYGRSTFFRTNSSNWGYSSMGTYLWSRRDQYTLTETCEIHAGDTQLYQTARVSPISLKYYGFCLKNGDYKVKLHFAEISSSNTKHPHSKAGRLFDVDIQGKNVLRNFNIEREAGGVNMAITKEYNTFVNDRTLEIHLYWSGKGTVSCPSAYYGPIISAITVVPAIYEPVQSKLSIGVLSGISGFALVLLTSFIYLSWRCQDKLLQEALELVELYPGGLYNYQKIKAATKNFHLAKRRVEGGFGTIYKGTLANGTDIAVKRLSALKEGMQEFVEKSRTITGMKHPNLATLMGCCAGKDELLLVYEYFGTDSLEDALFGLDELGMRLDWPTRYRICLGLAEGLAFLHEGSKQEIIHGDINPANIILDADLNPKIYDFGLARLYQKQKLKGSRSYTKTEVKDKASRPYTKTEVKHKASRSYTETEVKDKASTDVYSFGVITLLLVSGGKVTTPGGPTDTEYLVDEALKKDRWGTLMDLVEDNLDCDRKEANMILRIAIRCINPRPFRPRMSTVVKILRKEVSIETCWIDESKPEGDSPLRRTKSCLSRLFF